MRRLVLLGCTVGMLTAACTSEPEADIAASSTVVSTAAPLIVDDAAAATTPATSSPEAPVATESAAVSTTTTPPTTIAAAPATAPAATDPPATVATSAPTTAVESEPIGDGPVLTTPSNESDDETAAESPPIGSELAPVFFGIGAATKTACTEADPGTVTLRWEVIGTESVAIGIGTESQIFRLGESPAGSLDVPLDCTEGSTYFVIAENPGGRTVRSTAVAP